ncbi:MAG: WD40 repeat domain-containing protein [Planctomycetes bacterium]|nr:WD40 repeat domain-containing protein [Planctomycetota bacterium]
MWRMVMVGFGLVFFALPSQAQDKKRADILTLSKTGVFGLAFSPDGKMLASGSVGRPPHNELKLWDAETRELKASFSGHSFHILHVCFSPDGKKLATASSDKTVRLWGLEAGKEKTVVLREESPPKAVRFSNDGKTLGVTTYRKVRLLDAATGKEKSAINIHPAGYGHCFNPTLELMAFAPDSWYIHLVDTSTGKTKTLLTGLKGTMRAMTFSADGKWLASVSADGLLRVWDVAAGKLKASFRVDSGRCVALSRDGRYVAFGAWEANVRVWDVAANKELPSLKDKNLATIFCLAFSPDSKTLAAGGMGKIRLWALDAR